MALKCSTPRKCVKPSSNLSPLIILDKPELLCFEPNLCRTAPSCLHHGPVGCQSCICTSPGSPLTFLFPPSTPVNSNSQEVATIVADRSRSQLMHRNAHHISSIDGRCHLDFPEVLAICQLLCAADGSGAAAVV